MAKVYRNQYGDVGYEVRRGFDEHIGSECITVAISDGCVKPIPVEDAIECDKEYILEYTEELITDLIDHIKLLGLSNDDIIAVCMRSINDRQTEGKA